MTPEHERELIRVATEYEQAYQASESAHATWRALVNQALEARQKMELATAHEQDVMARLSALLTEK